MSEPVFDAPAVARSFLDAAWLAQASILAGVLSVPALALAGTALIRGR